MFSKPLPHGWRCPAVGLSGPLGWTWQWSFWSYVVTFKHGTLPTASSIQTFSFQMSLHFHKSSFQNRCFPRGVFPIDPVGSSSILLNATQLFIRYLCDHSFRFCNFKLVLLPISMHIFQIFLNPFASAVLSLTVALSLSLPPYSPLCYPEEEQWTGTIQKPDCYIVMNFSSTKQISPLLFNLVLFKFPGYWENAARLFQKHLEQPLPVSQRVFVSLWNLKN